MGFMNTYKRLDSLCRDMNGIGVTGYINDMDEISNGSYYVFGWENDYQKLKHYRYIRNQIAHESYADEENMCSDEDEEWLKTFHKCILEQSDPLALYQKKIKSYQRTNKPVSTKSSHGNTNMPVNNNLLNYSKKRVWLAVMIFASFVILAIIYMIITLNRL